MRIFRTLHHSILLLFAIVAVSIVTLVHFSVSKIVAEQSRAQQESISPAFQLIVEQLMKPLHVSQALAKSKELKGLMAAETLEYAEVMVLLERLNSEFALNFFIASETTKMHYNSDGTTIPLIEGKVDWYFAFKNSTQQTMADIGQWQDPQFYIDLKIYAEDGRFLGVFGVGKSLNSFLTVFNEYKDNYGHDFIFVDQNNDITLSSDPDLSVRGVEFTNLSDLHWYKHFEEERKQDSLNNLLVKINGQNSLLAELNIEPFDWTLYLITPLQTRQTELSQAFIFSVMTVLVVIFCLFLLIYNLLYYFKKHLQKGQQIDVLTEIANRSNVTLKFEELIYQRQSISLALINLDNFKLINETYGRKAGDTMLRQVAKVLQSVLRESDILGRWSGGEFILLMPNTNPEQALDMAERLRDKVAGITITTGTTSIQVTASFGLSFTELSHSLSEVISAADEALFDAKQNGRNRVNMQLIETVPAE